MARRSLKKKSGPIVTGKFSVEASKVYLIIGIVYFHILPLFFVFMGMMGIQILQSVFIDKLNPIIIFCLCSFHACRLGFCFKFPAIVGALSSLSLFMYYGLDTPMGIAGQEEGLGLMIFLLFTIVYFLFSFGSELIGGFIKKLIGG